MARAILQVLYRDSSDPDGVPGRGAGWHARSSAPRRDELNLEEALSGLAEGDVLKLASTPLGVARAFYVVIDGKLVELPPCSGAANQMSLSPEEFRQILKWLGRYKVDWQRAWQTCPPAERVVFAESFGLGDPGVTEALCAVLEALPPPVSLGPGVPGRALRLVRLSLLDQAGREELLQMVEEFNGLVDQTTELFDVYMLKALRALVRRTFPPFMYGGAGGNASVVPRFTAFAVDFLDPARIPEVNRSLDFLALRHLPLSALCLALGRKKGRAVT